MLSVNSLPAGGELILLTAVQLETSGELGDIRFTDVFLFSSSLKFFFLNSEQSLLKGGIIFVVSHTCVMQRSEVGSVYAPPKPSSTHAFLSEKHCDAAAGSDVNDLTSRAQSTLIDERSML